MSSYWGILLVVVLILVWIIAGGYITQANIKIRGFEGNDEFFKRAGDYTFWAAFITWFLVALFVLLIVLAIVGVVGLFSTGVGEAGEAEELEATTTEESSTSKLYKQYQNSQGGDEVGISWSTIIILFFAAVLVGITGILGALAAEQLKQSHLFTESNPDMITAYNDCVITAIICLSVVGLLVLGVIFYLFIGFFETPTTAITTITTTPTTPTTISVKKVPTTTVSTSTSEQIKLAEAFKKGKVIS